MHQSIIPSQISACSMETIFFVFADWQLLLGATSTRHQSGCPTNHVLARQGHSVEQRDGPKRIIGPSGGKVLFRRRDTPGRTCW